MSPNPTPALLSGLADELSSMIPVVEGLSALVFDHALKANAEDRSRILTQAQAVDDLSQRLEALRGLASALSRGADIQTALDALPLESMAARLRAAGVGGGPARDDGPDAGDLLLFG